MNDLQDKPHMLLVFRGLTDLLYGKEHIPNTGLHVRFTSLTSKTKSKAGQDHP